jgi:hypothetical protein
MLEIVLIVGMISYIILSRIFSVMKTSYFQVVDIKDSKIKFSKVVYDDWIVMPCRIPFLKLRTAFVEGTVRMGIPDFKLEYQKEIKILKNEVVEIYDEYQQYVRGDVKRVSRQVPLPDITDPEYPDIEPLEVKSYGKWILLALSVGVIFGFLIFFGFA